MTDLPTPLTDDAEQSITMDCDDSCVSIYVYCDGVIYEGGLVASPFARLLERRMAAARKLLAEARDILPMDMRVYERIQEAINHLTP